MTSPLCTFRAMNGNRNESCTGAHTLFRIILCAALFMAWPSDVWPEYGDARVPEWSAAETIQHAELIAVVDGPIRGASLWNSTVFAREGRVSIYRFAVVEVLCGNVDEGAEIVVAHPPAPMHRYAPIVPGESLLMLKKLKPDEINQLNQERGERSATWLDEDLAGDVWTFAWDKRERLGPGGAVMDGYQWMSWIQLKTIRPDGEIDETPRSILATQLNRYAVVEAERGAILTYVQELLTLRQAVLAGAELPDEEDLDRFQKAVMKGAVKELQESQE